MITYKLDNGFMTAVVVRDDYNDAPEIDFSFYDNRSGGGAFQTILTKKDVAKLTEAFKLELEKQ